MFDLLEPTHLLFVLLVALVVFGPTRLIEVSRNLGQSYQRLQEYKEQIKDELNAPPPDKEEQSEDKQPSTTSAVSASEKKG